MIQRNKRINIDFLSHTKAGKSTIIGRLKYECGEISQERIINDLIRNYASFIDDSSDEGVKLKTLKCDFTIFSIYKVIDTAKSDAAVLVIDTRNVISEYDISEEG